MVYNVISVVISSHSLFEDSQQEESLLQDFNNSCSMTYRQRLIAFLVCYCIGIVLMLCSLFAVGQILIHPAKFAVLYTLGNILALFSSCFMWGPVAQMRDMFKPIRAWATCLYLGCIVGTVFLCIYYAKAPLILLMIIIQCIAGFWYTISYIPYARTLVKKCMSSCYDNM